MYYIPLENLYTFYLNKSAELSVQVISKPISKIKWFKDNKELIIKDRYSIETIDVDINTKEYKFKIKDIQASDAGNYRVEASNKYSKQSCQTDIIIKGNNF